LSINLTLAPPIQLSSMTCAPQPVGPGASSICTVLFKSPTPPPGASISVRSSSTTVVVPAVLNVRAERSSVRFRADAASLANSQSAQLTSEYRGSSVRTTQSVASGGSPIISVPTNQAVIHGSKLEFQVAAADPGNLPVTLTVIGLPPGAQFNQSGLFQWTPLAFQIGTHTVRFRAANSAGMATLKEVVILVVQEKPLISALANSASLSLQAPCSPGGLASLLGTGITRNEPVSAAVLPLPTKLADVEVRINGTAVPLLFVSSTQVNFQCPILAAGTNLSVVVQSSLGASDPVNTQMRHASPGIFTLAANGKGQGAVFLVGEPSWAMIRNGAIPSRPALVDEFVSIYATGLGPVNGAIVEGHAAPAGALLSATSEVEVLIGGHAAEVQFAGLAPGFVGVFQVNARVPLGLAAGDDVPVVLRVRPPNGAFVQGNQVTMGVEGP
jgi:uncharacterized protein (TIGR03437 family)